MATDHPFKTTRIPSATPNQANNTVEPPASAPSVVPVESAVDFYDRHLELAGTGELDDDPRADEVQALADREPTTDIRYSSNDGVFIAYVNGQGVAHGATREEAAKELKVALDLQATIEENTKQELAKTLHLNTSLDFLLTPQELAARNARPKPTRPRVNDDNDYAALEDLDHDPDTTTYTEEQLLYGEDADFSDEDPEAPSMEIEW